MFEKSSKNICNISNNALYLQYETTSKTNVNTKTNTKLSKKRLTNKLNQQNLEL